VWGEWKIKFTYMPGKQSEFKDARLNRKKKCLKDGRIDR
jgi:hypothetical protein